MAVSATFFVLIAVDDQLLGVLRDLDNTVVPAVQRVVQCIIFCKDGLPEWEETDINMLIPGAHTLTSCHAPRLGGLS
jgi:hypothetical protein